MDLSVINEGQGKLGDGQKAKRIASRQKMINDDLPAYSAKHVSLMNFTMENGLKVREVIEHIDRCRDERTRDPKFNIEAPGLGWNGSSYC